MENLNGTLGSILTKMLVNKPVALWDQYLAQAVFAARVRIHATGRYSPYYLLFRRNPRLPDDENLIRPLIVEPHDVEKLEGRLERLQHARMAANQKLVERAIKAQKLRAAFVKESPFKEGDWVLVRAESRNKFEGRWFGPYQVVKRMLLGTYRLADPKGNVVRTLINGQRLIQAHFEGKSPEEFWNSSKIQGDLRKANISVEKSDPIVEELFAKDNKTPITYDELSTISVRDWKRLEQSGDSSIQVREGVQQVNPPTDLPKEVETTRSQLQGPVYPGNLDEIADKALRQLPPAEDHAIDTLPMDSVGSPL